MTLKTQLPWLDKDITDINTAYLQITPSKLRQRMLVQATTALAVEHRIQLLTFPPQKQHYSFSPETVFPQLAERLPDDIRNENIAIHPIDSATAVTDRIWNEITNDGIILADNITNLSKSKIGQQALDKAQNELYKTTTLFLDNKPPSSTIAEQTECIIELHWNEKGPIKTITKHPNKTPHTEPIVLHDTQKTLNDFAEASVV